jgi:hypothetical protein
MPTLKKSMTIRRARLNTYRPSCAKAREGRLFHLGGELSIGA